MLKFEWDDSKSKTNITKHKVSFELAASAFEDPFQLSDFDRTVNGEDRYQTLALVGPVILFIVHTIKEIENGQEVIRIISARKATANERIAYQQARGSTG
jgi:uncharacterized protein